MTSSLATALKIGSAIAIGVLLSVPWARFESASPAEQAEPVQARSMSLRSTEDLAKDPEPERQFAQVDGAYGFEQARDAAGSFIGYRVRGVSADMRFGEGDVITHVNDRPVEDSAAGSELLLAALTDPGAEVVLLKP